MDKEITIEYLRKLDKDENVHFISLTTDWFFKSFFKKYTFLLSKLLKSTLGLNINVKSSHFIDKEIIKDTEIEQQKYVDILISPNEYLLIDIECNSTDFNNCMIRNFAYVDKLYGTIFEVGDKYKELGKYKVVQLNFNTKETNHNRYKQDVIYETGEKTSKIYQKNKKIVLKYLAYYRYLYYTLGIRTPEVVLCTLLTSKGYVEFYKVLSNILKKDKLDEVTKGVIEMNGIDYNLHAWKHEMWDNYIRMNEKESNIAIGKEQGISIGKEQGISIGKEQGISIGTIETKENIVNNMLRKNMPYELISEVSDVPVEEVKKLAKRLSSQVS